MRQKRGKEKMALREREREGDHVDVVARSFLVVQSFCAKSEILATMIVRNEK